MRKIDLERNTKETQITLSLNLDGSGKSDHKIELPFFSHMLEQVSKHGDFDINLSLLVNDSKKPITIEGTIPLR